MKALLTIDENWRPTSDGWVSYPWDPLGGPTKYIIYNILIINGNILYFLVC